MTNHSISVVVASGNSQEDSCTIAPGRGLPLSQTSTFMNRQETCQSLSCIRNSVCTDGAGTLVKPLL